jgi:Phosphotransferase enzyme family
VPEEPQAHKAVTLVVLHEGSVLGAVPPFDIEPPWWQEVGPISRRFPELVVLRLLDAPHPPALPFGGPVTYLVEPRSPSFDVTRLELAPWPGAIGEDPLRMPWASPGGPAADLAWVASQVCTQGDPVQQRTWNLSAIWTIPTQSGRAWLKCVPPFFAHERDVLELLRSVPVPRLIAAEGHRLLLEDLPGADGYDATLSQRRALIDELVALQVWCAPRVSEFLDRGVPDRRWPALLAAARDLVSRRAPDDIALRQLLDTADARIAAIDACGLPDTLVHGDAHAGNARIGADAGKGIWFDWGDSRVGNPVLDVGVLDRPGAPHADALRAHWLAAWGKAAPGSDPERAWRLARPLAALGNAIVYQFFLDQIEATERIYHDGDVVPWLEAASIAASTE